MDKSERQSIWTRAFALLCVAEFLGYAQHFVLQPTFPLYITHLGGAPFTVGLVIAGFGVASVLSRPLIGYWADPLERNRSADSRLNSTSAHGFALFATARRYDRVRQ
jgi:MFS family permease